MGVAERGGGEVGLVIFLVVLMTLVGVNGFPTNAHSALIIIPLIMLK